MGRARQRRRGTAAAWAAVSLSVLGLLAYAAYLAAGMPPALDWAVNNVVYNGSIFAAALACFARAVSTRRLRGAWIAFGLGLAFWGAGDVYWVAALAELKKIPYPSWADAGYLLAIPCFFVAIAMLAHERLGHAGTATWFDGAIAALATAAGASALLAPALVGLTEGDPATVLTNMAYPISDLLLIAFIAAVVAVSGLREARGLILIAAGLLAWTAGDGMYLWIEATGAFRSGWFDMLWLIGAALIAVSAALSPRQSVARVRRYRSGLVVPLLSIGVAVTVLVWDHFDTVHEASIWLAAAAVALVAARLIVSFRENERLVEILHDDAVTDPLTELGNRRALINDLQARLADSAAVEATYVFALFDLDGFKFYNDSFGHPAGDSLLRRLGASLAQAVAPDGAAYRLGGDEFCILVPAREAKVGPAVERARAALSERGEGFEVGASVGHVLLPAETRSPSEALRLADKRLYAEKAVRATRSGEQTRALLLRVQREREPELGEHVDGVARRALEVGRALALDAESLDVLRRAAELHDIGKIAIPEEVLHKPGRLNENEWELMRRHTLIGERILGITPPLVPVGRVVRSTHERWDGTGYPDGLAAEEIPREARIIFVCDAFEAMTADRPYHAALTPDAALAELRANAGTQFDPEVVDLFCSLYARERTVLTG